MVNSEEIYGAVKYRTELGEGGISACTQPPVSPLKGGHSAPVVGSAVRQGIVPARTPPVFPLKGRFWRAADCRPYAVCCKCNRASRCAGR